MQKELSLKFIKTNSQGESLKWLFELLEKYEKN